VIMVVWAGNPAGKGRSYTEHRCQHDRVIASWGLRSPASEDLQEYSTQYTFTVS
jgi:hypothetical protein